MQENLETVAARTGRYLLFALAGGSLMEISRLFCELYWPLSDEGWRLGPVELTCHSYFLQFTTLGTKDGQNRLGGHGVKVSDAFYVTFLDFAITIIFYHLHILWHTRMLKIQSSFIPQSCNIKGISTSVNSGMILIPINKGIDVIPRKCWLELPQLIHIFSTSDIPVKDL